MQLQKFYLQLAPSWYFYSTYKTPYWDNSLNHRNQRLCFVTENTSVYTVSWKTRYMITVEVRFQSS